ncbi:metal ABC transporter substrate-binding protein [Neobacillus sp. D3-1R]|uniref:metal ABC transporter substrate-binding protein n=1 Tax=Neobacillus sp. D3-1R TaxID=3445778 RepID=UPI003F9FD0EA
MRKALIFSFFLLLVSSFVTGCAPSEKDINKDSGKLTVYTTVYPLKYFTERIAGDLVTVDTIYPAGADEHTFEPSQRDMMTLADSDLFIYIGLGLEGFVEKAKTTLKNEDVTLVAAGEKLNPADLTASHDEEEHEHGDIDPHVWLDPVYANELALAIKDALVEKLPDKKETFETNYQKLSKELAQLDSSFQTTISNSKQKDIIVSHSAFGYWEKRYGLHQISITGLSTASEPSQKDLEEIVKIADEKNLHYIFFEQNVSSKLGKILQNEIGAKPLTLHNLATLTEENLQNKETYFTLMNQNLQVLSKALNE